MGRLASALLVVILLAPTVDAAEGFPVGFSIVDWQDSRRPFDTWGSVRARPVRVFTWYPATLEASDPMTLADYHRIEADTTYLGEAPSDPDMLALRSQFSRRQSLDEAQIDEVLATRLVAGQDLPREEGIFPAVVLFADLSTLAYLAENLARSGFAVFAPARLAAHTHRPMAFRPNSVSLDTDVDDLRFVYDQMVSLDYVDAGRVGGAAFSSATLSTLLWQMQDFRMRALVAIEGWEGFLEGANRLEASPYYRPRAIRIAHLLVEKSAEERNEDYAKTQRVFDAMPFAELERFTFDEAAHATFLTGSRAVAMVRGDSTGVVNHDDAVDAVTEFLLRTVAGQSTVAVESAQFTRSTRRGLPPVPTQEEMARLLERGKFERVKAAVEASPDDPGLAFDRTALRRVVRELPAAQALPVFLWITEMVPTSCYAWIDVANTHSLLSDVASQLRALEQARLRVADDPSIEDEARQRLAVTIDEEMAGLSTDDR